MTTHTKTRADARRWLGALMLTLLLAPLHGCLPADEPATDEAVIRHAWTLVDERYALFADREGLDWSGAQDRALADLASAPAQDDRALFDTLAGMLGELEDGHVNLRTPFDLSWDRPRYQEEPPQYDGDLMERHVLAWTFRMAGGLRYATLPGTDVGYLRIRDFMSIPGEASLEAAFSSFQGRSGLIIDLRGNGGGRLEDMFRVLSRLVDAPTAGMRIAFKDGPAHDDLTTPEARDFGPADGARFTGPVALLVDRRTYSAANTFSFIMKRRGDATLVGTPTGGGGSAPVWFELPNGWTLRLSTSRMTDADGAPMEPGLAPDVPARLDPELRAQGRDAVVEAALDALR